jgi:hypothetical protein
MIDLRSFRIKAIFDPGSGRISVLLQKFAVGFYAPGAKYWISFVLILLLLLAACTSGGTAGANPEGIQAGVAAENTAVGEQSNDASGTRLPAQKYEAYDMVTLLPRDAIPAIDNPQFLSASEADEYYDADELVLGVEFNGDARAYSVPFLSSYEIVNDTVGGEKIAVTW